MCAGVVFPWSSRSVPKHQEQSLSYPGRRRTSKTVALQRHEFESRCDSTLPYPSPVLGMAKADWNLPAPAPDDFVTCCTREVARGVYEMTAKLCQLLSAGDVAQEARLIGIDRWMIRRSYCVCGSRLARCDRVRVIKGEKPLLERGRWGKLTLSKKQQQRNTTIHLLT